jgi:hypothetical protein
VEESFREMSVCLFGIGGQDYKAAPAVFSGARIVNAAPSMCGEHDL